MRMYCLVYNLDMKADWFVLEFHSEYISIKGINPTLVSLFDGHYVVQSTITS